MTQAEQRIVVDSRGSFCPGPITDLYKAYRRANVGDVIELLATDPAAKSDVQAWARKTGNEVLEIVDEQGYIRIVIKVLRKR
ncbi:MAG TPA: sulfurtransferase TusA family protein [Candidatus Caldiarchaeum subterraneum]|uniref:Sulfurtransferase TusA family protein n=1 Tax=Caldiarchaeum subterraneum TaxID=311458 RepID=A0A833EAF4_CALS0|nr:sulfurtransferase TusA family protein [Aigarchaeota archaeon]HIQ30224.1 sulfurtransferase TusA family protein [Candidatus Caldarchaeum subterraneum]